MDKVRMQHHHITSQLEYEYVLGPIKIKDGLFMGDELAAKDIEFILTNKVSHVVNTVSRRIPNIWEKISVRYLTYNWTENQQNIFDKKNNRLNEIFNFIEEAMEQGQSCLVHSVNAKSRAFVVVAAYMMKKYSWSLEKTLQYITLKKPQLDVRQNFYYQLKELEGRLNRGNSYTTNWTEARNQEDLILRNTYINSKAIQYTNPPNKPRNTRKVTWQEAERPRKPQSKDPTPERKGNNQGGSSTKSILKTAASSKVAQEPTLKPQEPQQEPQIINNINGNVIHLTVNNYIGQDEPAVDSNSRKNVTNPLMARPFSSDAKERQKRRDPQQKDGRKLVYDNFFSGLKSSPYQPKFMSSKIPPKSIKPPLNNSSKKEQEKGPLMAFQRPQSASNTDKKKIATTASSTIRGMAPNMGTRDEFVVTNGGKRPVTMGRYPSPMVVPRDSDNLVISSTQYRDKWRGL